MSQSHLTTQLESVRFSKWALATVVFLCLRFAATARAEQAIDLPQIVAALEAWRNQFSNFSVTDHTSNRHDLEERFPELREQSLEGFARRTTWTWSDTGKTRKDFQRVVRGVEQQVQQSGCDGTTYYTADIAPRPSGETGPRSLIELRLDKPPNRPLASNIMQGAIYGLWDSGSGVWYVDTLKRENPGVEMAEYEGRKLPSVVTDRGRVFFDPEHGLLPCWIDASQRRGKPGGWNWKVLEWGRHATGLIYPMRGTIYRAVDAKDSFDEWAILDVTLNANLAPTFFSPPQPTQGTLVADLLSGKHYRFGSSKMAASPDTGVAAPAPKATAGHAEGNPNLATAAAGRWWFYVIVLLSVACLAGAYLMRRGTRTGA